MDATISVPRSQTVDALASRLRIRRGWAFGAIIIAALLAFELFNYSTTEFALSDLLGSLEFASIHWSTILAIAFCGIDFAGIARLFTPEEGENEPNEVWYLFGAWLLAATMNAMLTWWGVSLAILNHETLGNAVITRESLLRVVPVFVAVMVWLIRVLIIGTFSVAGERLFSQAETHGGHQANRKPLVKTLGGQALATRPVRTSRQPSNYRPAPKPAPQSNPTYNRAEPTYHPVGMSAHTSSSSGQSAPKVRR